MKIINNTKLKNIEALVKYCVSISGVKHRKLLVKIGLGESVYSGLANSNTLLSEQPEKIKKMFNNQTRIDIIDIWIARYCGGNPVTKSESVNKTILHELRHIFDVQKHGMKNHKWIDKAGVRIPWKYRPQEIYACEYANKIEKKMTIEHQDLILNLAVELSERDRIRELRIEKQNKEYWNALPQVQRDYFELREKMNCWDKMSIQGDTIINFEIFPKTGYIFSNGAESIKCESYEDAINKLLTVQIKNAKDFVISSNGVTAYLA